MSHNVARFQNLYDTPAIERYERRIFSRVFAGYKAYILERKNTRAFFLFYSYSFLDNDN